MTLPGSVVEIVDAAPPATTLIDTGTAFVVGLSERGAITGQLTPDDAVHSLGEWVAAYGDRQSYNGLEYDTVEAFFADGGTRLFFARYAGPAAVKASRAVPTSSSKFTATAVSEGAWGNDITVAVASGVITVSEDGVVKETSPALADIAAAQAWAAASSSLITITPLTTGALADSAALALQGGADDRTNATDTERTAALARMGRDLGPGVVLMPGDSRGAAHTLLATHARDNNRFAYGDAPDSPTAATVAAAGTAVRTLGRELARHIQLLEPWLTAPALTAGGATRTIPPSGVQAGMAARNDAAGNPNRAVAGRNGASRFALGVKYARLDSERETLADAGVTVIRLKDGLVQTYDDVTPVDPDADPEWLGAAGNRLVMRIVADAYDIADAHMFGSVAGPVDLAAFGGDLTGMLLRWFQVGALYSADGTPAGAFRVETGAAVNTAETLAARQLKAALALKISPNARQVLIEITNTPVESAV
jgi:hypothetical protein